MMDATIAGPVPAEHRVTNPARPVLAKALIGTAVVALLGGGAGYGHHYWAVGRFLESTDDAYVKADSTIVAPRVSGHLAEVLVVDNQPVRAGESLARIDDRDFRTALDAARADVETARAAIRTVEAQTVLQRTAIEQQD
jgi:membrane fusion protein (multidrug efflux system)